MTVSLLFAAGLGCTAVLSVMVVLYLRQPLQALLIEVCGNAKRAEFWTVFSAVTVGLVPLIFALGYEPAVDSARPALLEVAGQLKWGLIGMLGSVLMLGWGISRYIPRPPQKP